MMSDLDVLKEIPGYKAILKSVLKSQIHLLMEQLSEHTGEESIILTASVHDGSLSHLGSNTGKGFLEGRDEIKSQFLGYCLKTYHKKKTHEPQKPYQRTHPSPRSPAQLPTPPAKRPRPEPISLTMATSINTYPQSNIIPADISDSNVGFGSSGAIDNSIVSVKMEQEDNQSADISQQEPSDSVTSGDKSNLPESVHLSHTQTSGANNDNDTIEDSAETEQTDISDLSTIKVEQVEDELEITGVEMAAGSLDNWGQGQSGYGESDTSFDQSADQASYMRAMTQNVTTWYDDDDHENYDERMYSSANCSSLSVRSKDYYTKETFDVLTEDLVTLRRQVKRLEHEAKRKDRIDRKITLDSMIEHCDNEFKAVEILLLEQFDKDTLMNCSVSGKRANSKVVYPKKPLDSDKMGEIRRVIQRKFPSIQKQELTNKIHSVQRKLKRQSEKTQ